MDEISEGLATSRHDVIERAAHTLKSTSAYVGLLEVNAIAGALEAMAHRRLGLQAIGEHRDLLAVALDRGRPYLEAALAAELESARPNRRSDPPLS